MIDDTDRKYLQRCVDLASEALDRGNEPFGSVLVSSEGEVLFEDYNRIGGGDHTQHPEFAIARWAANNMDVQDRAKATVYTLANTVRCAPPPMAGWGLVESSMQALQPR